MKWISVDEKLREEEVRVLTLDNRNPSYPQYKVDYIVGFPHYNPPYIWACRIEDDQENVTHWMPLPEPPCFIDKMLQEDWATMLKGRRIL